MPTPQNASAWKPVDESNQWTPVQDSAPAAATPPPAPQTMLQKVLGVNPVMDTLSSVGTHLKNLVAAPYHAFTDDPRNPDEQKLLDEHGGTGNPILNVFNRAGLGANRMLVQPIVNAVKESNQLRKAGGPQSSMWAPSSYDAEGNNIPTAGSKLIDAIPLVGPWSRGYADEVHQKGVLPATAGLATDVLAPKYGGKGVAAGLSKVAPVLAETALKVRGADRAYGATPGKAILERTSGLSPAKVVNSARDSMNELQADQNRVLSGAPGTVDLTPVRNIVADYATRATEENHPGTIKDIEKLGQQVHEDYASGQPLPQDVTPLRAAALNRGISNARTGWNPATANDTMNSAAGQMHHELAGGIEKVVPEVAPINQEMQSLHPVIRRATAADLNAGLLQRVSGRFGAHTGALAGGLAGFKFAGIPGAIAGIFGPELAASPEVQMGLARGAHAAAPIIRKVGPAVTAAAVSEKRR